MSLGPEDLRLLADRASEAAREAGAFIATSRPRIIERKTSGSSAASQVVTEIDRRAELIILEALAPTLQQFDLGVLSEERPDTGSRRDKEHFWCIDPLDGTLPFVEGEAGFAVSIALVSKRGLPSIGVTFDPVSGVLYRAARGLGVCRNGQPWAPGEIPLATTLSVFLDRSFAGGADFQRVAAAIQTIAHGAGLEVATIHTGAGAVMNACQVLENPPACYFKFPKATEGGGSLWDFAATACLFREAGAVSTDIHGGELDLNRPDSTFMNHRGVLFVSDESFAGRIRGLYASSAPAPACCSND